MEKRSTQSRGGVKGESPLRGQGAELPCGVCGNAPTVPRATSMSNALNKGAGSEASLPVTSRSRRSAPKLLFRPTQYCRARWARPTSRGSDSASCCWSFSLQGFRLRGGESGALRSPPTPLRSALPCFLIFYVAGGFRACGRESGALRSPPTPLHSALPCCLTFLVAKGSCIYPLLFREKSFRSVHSLLARRGKVCYNTHG